MEQKINKYLSLRLIHGLTEVFVGETRINQRRLVLMSFPMEKVEELGHFETIDELSEFAERNELDFTPEITPEEEFWANCSAIQAWVEFFFPLFFLRKISLHDINLRISEIK